MKLSNKVDFVASTALGGAFNAKLLGNQVTLAFAQDRKEAERIVRAYQRFRGKNIGLDGRAQALRTTSWPSGRRIRAIPHFRRLRIA